MLWGVYAFDGACGDCSSPVGPIVSSMGLDMVWFAILPWSTARWSHHPAVWQCAFCHEGVAPADTTMVDVYKAAMPLNAINIIVMLIILFFPETAVWLPSVTLTK